MQTMMDVWIQQGEQQTTSTLTVKQLQWRFGSLDDETQTRIRALPLAQLKQLGAALPDFSQPDDLAAWLHQHGQQVR